MKKRRHIFVFMKRSLSKPFSVFACVSFESIQLRKPAFDIYGITIQVRNRHSEEGEESAQPYHIHLLHSCFFT